MRKLFCFIVVFFLSFSFVSTISAAENPFEITGNFIYELTSTGIVKVREEVHIKNLTTETYAPSFTFDTNGFSPDNVSIFENGLASKIEKNDDGKYTTTFKRPAVGKGANKTVVIVFNDSSLVTKRGGVFEIRFPRVQNNQQFSSINTTIRVSQEDSNSFHIFPKTAGVTKAANVEYYFNSSGSDSSPITAFLGDVAAYDFTLKYPFTNSSFFNREVKFALPPDTPYQKVYIHSFSQKPDSLEYDSDGNWIGKLTLKPRQENPFEVTGVVFVFADPQQQFPLSNDEAVKLNTSSQKYWESNDPEIVKLANELQTPKAIYEYVVSNLSYDYAKTGRPQERLGAKLTLSKKTEAICMEFTDLFIALARAAHIPAREINGFAISTDNTQPRGLGEDILHSWPEYWDSSTHQWIPVDPTWGNTTGGVDYFSHFDLNHIVFVVHGVSSMLPQTPGTYDTVDQKGELIKVEPSVEGKEEQISEPVLQVAKKGFSLWEQTYEVTVENPAGQALYNIPVVVSTDGKIVENKEIVSVLPFSKTAFTFSTYAGFFGFRLPHVITVAVGNNTKDLIVSSMTIALFHIVVLLLPLILVPTLVAVYFKNHAKH